MSAVIALTVIITSFGIFGSQGIECTVKDIDVKTCKEQGLEIVNEYPKDR